MKQCQKRIDCRFSDEHSGACRGSNGGLTGDGTFGRNSKRAHKRIGSKLSLREFRQMNRHVPVSAFATLAR